VATVVVATAVVVVVAAAVVVAAVVGVEAQPSQYMLKNPPSGPGVCVLPTAVLHDLWHGPTFRTPITAQSGWQSSFLMSASFGKSGSPLQKPELPSKRPVMSLYFSWHA